MTALLAPAAGLPGTILDVRPLGPEALAHLAGKAPAELRSRAVVSWEQPQHGRAIFALGAALECTGRGHLPELRDAARSLFAGLGPVERSLARVFVAAAFDPANPARASEWDGFGAWRMVVPSVLLEQRDGAWSGSEIRADARRAAAGPRSGASARSAAGLEGEQWKAAVAEAVRRIDRGDLDKVVLARQVRGLVTRRLEEALEQLARVYPNCFVFRFATPGGDWIGASPERLVAVEDGQVRAASLAGSRRRGSTEQEDRVLAEGLMRDPKERAEHAVVVRAVRQALESACDDVQAACEPLLMRMANIQHLYTPVSGRLRPGLGVLDLVERMHPTPAVGGWPRERALAAIRELEQLDRGWYAGPVGWFDGDGNGEFAVALRTARVAAGVATLYGGAGIVAGSDPERELAETALKMRPLADALGMTLWT